MRMAALGRPQRPPNELGQLVTRRRRRPPAPPPPGGPLPTSGSLKSSPGRRRAPIAAQLDVVGPTRDSISLWERERDPKARRRQVAVELDWLGQMMLMRFAHGSASSRAQDGPSRLLLGPPRGSDNILASEHEAAPDKSGGDNLNAAGVHRIRRSAPIRSSPNQGPQRQPAGGESRLIRPEVASDEPMGGRNQPPATAHFRLAGGRVRCDVGGSRNQAAGRWRPRISESQYPAPNRTGLSQRSAEHASRA